MNAMEHLFRTITILNVFLTIFHCLAIGLTVFRLHYRHRTGRLWLDDYLAACAAGLDAIEFVILWMGYAHSESPLETILNRKIRYGIGLISVVSTEWITRISLALAFARIFPAGEPTRGYAIGLAIFFAMLFISALIQGILVCSKASAWLNNTGLIQCSFPRRAIIFLVVANIVGDTLLVVSPIYKLRRVKLPQNQRRLIFTCIAGSTLMSLSCLATSVFQLGPASWEPARGFIRVLLGYLESGVSLTICNLLVVVTYLYTVTHKRAVSQAGAAVQSPKTSPSPTAGVATYQSNHLGAHTSIITPITLTEITGAYFTRTATDC